MVTGGALVVAAPGAQAVVDKIPVMPTKFTTSVAPVPSFVASAGGALSLTRQTISGMAAQKYGLTPGMTTTQINAVRAGFSSSLTYPTVAPGSAILSAVGVLRAGNVTPVSSAAPGCSPNKGGTASRVVVTRSGSTYRLSVSGSQKGGFVPVGAWRLPAHGAEQPIALTVLDTTCSFDASSAIAVTYPSGIDYFAYDGSGTSGYRPAPVGGELVPTATWRPEGTRVLASAHVNSDASYLPVVVPDPESNSPDVGNATMLAVTAADDGSVSLDRLELTALQPGGGQSFVQHTSYDVAFLPDAPITGASLAYDNRAQGSINDASYALAVRAGNVNHVWFGIVGRSVSPPDRVIAQDGACAGSGLPQVAVATGPGINGTPFTGIACSVQTGSATVVQRWSDYTADADDPNPPNFPSNLNPSMQTTLPAMIGVRPFVTWPCVLLSEWATEQQPARPACASDLGTDLVGTRGSAAARFYQLPVVGGAGGVASREIAGAQPGASALVDAMPLARTTLSVTNSAAKATAGTTPPVPVVYAMPAPMITGLTQPRAGAPVAFGTTTGTGTGTSSSFGTSVGATVSATLGDPSIAALQLAASAEQATKTTDTGATNTITGSSVNDNFNKGFIVYSETPVWTWQGIVDADSTGISADRTRVLTQIARRDLATTNVVKGITVADAADQFANLFGPTGVYAPTLLSVFGPGLFTGVGRTVRDADPAAYPQLTAATGGAPQQDGSPFCDTPTGSSGTGVTSINSGVPSPYTEGDSTAGGGSFRTVTGGLQTVRVGEGLSDEQTVTVGSSREQTYSTDFSVNASAGVSIGGVTATVEAGFTIGNQTSVSTTASQTFSSEIGPMKGAPATGLPAGVASGIKAALNQTQTYTWEPFMCRRTTAILGNGQTSALVLGFATSGFTGIADVTTGAPTAITGSDRPSTAPTLTSKPVLKFDRSGPTAAFEVVVSQEGVPVGSPVVTAVKSPPASAAGKVTQAVTFPTKLTKGVLYSWQPTAINYDGVRVPGTVRYFTVG